MKKRKKYKPQYFFVIIFKVFFSIQPIHAQYSEIDDYMTLFYNTGNFSGSILVAQNDSIIIKKNYGMANYELNVPNSFETKFHIASVSKPFTAATILLLQEKGLLDVHNPVEQFIHDYPNGETISIHQLLTHTSGIVDVNQISGYDAQSRFPNTIEQVVSLFKYEPLLFEPGIKSRYSNSNYVLLAYIIELVTNVSYGEQLKNNIFLPLEMNNSGHDGYEGKLLYNRASGYVPININEFENAPYLNFSIKAGQGSIYSTIDDMYKWDQAIFNHELLSTDSWEQMFKTYKNSGSWGYGWIIDEHLEKKVIWINGRSPGVSAYHAHYINDNLAIILLSNIDVPNIQMGKDIASIMFGEEYKIPESYLVHVHLEDNELDQLVGSYQFGDNWFTPNHVITIYRNGDRLYSKGEGRRNTDVPLISLSNSEVFHRVFWNSIIFDRDQNGSVISLFYESFPNKPAIKIE